MSAADVRPADDAGEVAAGRAEVERLRALGGEVQNARGDAETRAAEARVTAESLGKAVSDLATDLEKNRRGARSNGYSGAYNDGHHDARVEIGHRLRAILTAADPVSLTNVRDGGDALAVAIHPDARKADGTPSLHLSISAVVQETIEDVIADCGDNSTGVLASNIARVLAGRIEAVTDRG